MPKIFAGCTVNCNPQEAENIKVESILHTLTHRLIHEEIHGYIGLTQPMVSDLLRAGRGRMSHVGEEIGSFRGKREFTMEAAQEAGHTVPPSPTPDTCQHAWKAARRRGGGAGLSLSPC